MKKPDFSKSGKVDPMLVIAAIIAITVVGIAALYGMSTAKYGPFAEEKEMIPVRTFDTVRATVTDASTGDPIETQGIEMTMSAISDLSDPNGRFALTDISSDKNASYKLDDTDNNRYAVSGTARVWMTYEKGTPEPSTINLGEVGPMWTFPDNSEITFNKDWNGLSTSQAVGVENTVTEENYYIVIANSVSDTMLMNAKLEIHASDPNGLLTKDPTVEQGNANLVVDNAYDAGADYHISLGDMKDDFSTGTVQLQFHTNGTESAQAGNSISVNATLDDTNVPEGTNDNMASVTKSLDVTFA